MKKQIYETFSLGFLITKSSRMLMKVYEERFSHIEVSPLQSGVLYTISFLDKPSQKEIAGILHIDKVTLSKIVLNLSKAKMISNVQVEGDRREKRWIITKKGLQKLDQIGSVDVEINKLIEDRLTKTEQASLSKILKKLLTEGLD